jgi:large subunit ribosomal protein L6
MSRIGKHPVAIPKGVTAKIDGNKVHVKGPKGELERELHSTMKVTLKDDQILVERPSDDDLHKSLHGLSRTLVANMVEGVTKGFKKELELVGVGYQVVVEGANKEVVGQVAAEIRSIRPPEPYKGKGIKYAGEQVRRKAGKAGKAGAK